VQSALICRQTGSCQRRARQECAEKCDTKENCSDLPAEPRAAPPGQHGLVSGLTRPVKLSLNYHRSPSITIAGFRRISRCREFGKVACALTRAEHRGRTLIHGHDRSAVPLGNLGHRNTSPTSSMARYLCSATPNSHSMSESVRHPTEPMSTISRSRTRRPASMIRQQMCDVCLPVDVRHVGLGNGSSGPGPLAFDATHRLGGGAADHLGVAVGGVVTLPGKLPTTNP
jgi:hypothetical protein